MKFHTPKIYFLCFCMIVCADRIIFNDRIELDGGIFEIISPLTFSNTIYSEGYSHKKFRTIKIGITKNEVINILGEPLYKWKPYGLGSNKRHYEGYGYSRHPKSSYRIRQINFNNDTVAEVVSYFYLD